MAADRVLEIDASRTAMLEQLELLVMCESPSAVPEAASECVELFAPLAEAAFGRPSERITVDGRTHLVLPSAGATKVLIVGHLDTVWPLGTTARWPFSLDGDVVTGPGAFDMKAGLIQLLAALRALRCSTDGLALVVTTDEEIGSPTSRELIESMARAAEAALVFEPSAAGALKVARKGVSLYQLEVVGRAAHAGLEPEKGANAAIGLAHAVLALEPLARTEVGTTVTPTVLSAGTTTNTVPARARADVDVRALTREEQDRVDREMRGLRAVIDGTTLTIGGGPNRPPLDQASSALVFAVAQRAAKDLGMEDLVGVVVGGGSDGNFTAGAGTPTLDGLGAVGGNAHAEGEWVSVSAMAERAALAARLIELLVEG